MKSLIADDDAVSISLFKTILSKYGKCDTVSNGNDALNEFKTAVSKKSQYDLIILDIMMPDISGYKVFKFIRSSEKATNAYNPHCTKIILVTGLDDFENRQIEKSLNKECEAFLLKSADTHQDLLNILHGFGIYEV